MMLPDIFEEEEREAGLIAGIGEGGAMQAGRCKQGEGGPFDEGVR
jgi:hypothetical protein